MNAWRAWQLPLGRRWLLRLKKTDTRRTRRWSIGLWQFKRKSGRRTRADRKAA